VLLPSASARAHWWREDDAEAGARGQVSALREGEVNDVFFAALDHVRDIHQNCKVHPPVKHVY
jgi:hypothetical protein